MHPDEERIPLLAYLVPYTACPPPLDCVEAAPYDEEVPPAPRSPPLASDSTPSFGVITLRDIAGSQAPPVTFSQLSPPVFLQTCPAFIEK